MIISAILGLLLGLILFGLEFMAIIAISAVVGNLVSKVAGGDLGAAAFIVTCIGLMIAELLRYDN